MISERRNSDRYCFNFDLLPEGDLILLSDGVELEVIKLVDISPFGTCLSIDRVIACGCTVTLQYRVDACLLQANGRVVWSGPENRMEEGAGFRAGVDFNRDQMQMNVAVFKALTECFETRTPLAVGERTRNRIFAFWAGKS